MMISFAMKSILFFFGLEKTSFYPKENEQKENEGFIFFHLMNELGLVIQLI